MAGKLCVFKVAMVKVLVADCIKKRADKRFESRLSARETLNNLFTLISPPFINNLRSVLSYCS